MEFDLVQSVALFIVFVAVILGWVWVFQERMVFFPSPKLEGSPADVGLPHEEVCLRAADGVLLHGWYVPCEDARGTVLFCHGNAGNISHRLETLAVLHALCFSVLIFDYRGYGRSEGRPGEDGLYLDAEAAWDHLVHDRGESASRIVLMGRSLGGGVASWLAAHREPAALILESTFTSLVPMARRFYPWLPSFLLRIRFDTASRLSRIRCPLLVAHSPGDELVPEALGRGLYEAYDGPKRFLRLTGDHSQGWLETGGAYVDGLNNFLMTDVKL